MAAFQPTHVIQHDSTTVEVMLVDGVAYQRGEWDDTTDADYERTDDGRWLFQGETFNGSVESIADRTQRLYREAEARVRGDDRLAPLATTILADFPEGDDHWQWVIDADADEILAWAEAAR